MVILHYRGLGHRGVDSTDGPFRKDLHDPDASHVLTGPEDLEREVLFDVVVPSHTDKHNALGVVHLQDLAAHVGHLRLLGMHDHFRSGFHLGTDPAGLHPKFLGEL